MGIDFSKTSKLTDLTSQTGNLRNIINSNDQEDRKAALKQLFTQSYFNNTAEKGNIENQIKVLQEKIDKYETRVEQLEEQLSGKQEELEKISDEIADQVEKIVRKTGKFEEQSKTKIDDAMYWAIENYRRKPIRGKHISEYIAEQMQDVMPFITKEQGAIKALVSALNTPQSKVSSLASELEGVIGDIDMLDSEYATTKSTLELLKLTNNTIANSANSYQTSDTSSAIPIFTPQKAEIADGFLAQYNTRLAGKETQTTKATAITKESVIEKYTAIVQPQTSGVDAYSTDNAQLMSFDKALDEGLVNDMESAGFTQKEMLDTIKQLFPSIGIYHGSNGQAVIPWGHWNNAERRTGMSHKNTAGADIYAKFTEQFNSVGTKPNTSAEQIEEMNKAITNDDIIGKMKDGNFSWKECAYTLTRLWPLGGVEYKLGENKISIPKGDSSTSATYDKLAKEISENYPNVTINRGTTTGAIGGSTQSVKRTDPVGFSIGNSSFEFIIDRNNDNKFDNFNEMVGANGVDAIDELKSFDTSGDGILQGEELNNLLVFNVDHATTSSDKTNFGFITASQLGIASIDLNTFEEKTRKSGDGSKNDYVDINNSLVAGTFDVTLDKKAFENATGIAGADKAEGYQKFVSNDYITNVYNPLLGNNITISLNESEVDAILNEAFNDSNNEMSGLNKLKYEYIHKEWLLKGDLKTALDSKVDNVVNEIMGHKASKESKAIGIALTSEKIDTIYTEAEADTVISNKLDNTETEGYGTRIKEELIEEGYLNPLYQEEK